MKFLIDDEKMYLPDGTDPDIIARNFLAGAFLLSQFLEKDELYIDHDLGDEDPDRTGYALLKIMEKEVALYRAGGGQVHIPRKIICVSNNPAGRSNINAAIASIRRFEKEHQDVS